MESSILIAKMVGALAIIFAIMGLFVWGLRKFGNLSIPGSKGLIEIIENRALGPKRYLSLVKIGGSYYVIASTESQVTLLDTIDSAKFDSFEKVLDSELKKADEG